MNNQTPDDLGAEYIVGSMTPAEQMQFENEMKLNARMLDAVRSFDDTCEVLINSVAPVVPDASIRESLLKRIESESRLSSTDSVPLIRRSSDDDWRKIGVPGARLRVLNVDRANNRMTAILRLEPNCKYPSHAHDQDEECFMLEGDLEFSDYQLKAGDYLRVQAGTSHAVSRTVGGCLCLITCAVPKWLAA